VTGRAGPAPRRRDSAGSRAALRGSRDGPRPVGPCSKYTTERNVRVRFRRRASGSRRCARVRPIGARQRRVRRPEVDAARRSRWPSVSVSLMHPRGSRARAESRAGRAAESTLRRSSPQRAGPPARATGAGHKVGLAMAQLRLTSTPSSSSTGSS
jgi:hypothetical protein